MDTVTRVQILDEADDISLCTNTLEKSMNLLLGEYCVCQPVCFRVRFGRWRTKISKWNEKSTKVKKHQKKQSKSSNATKPSFIYIVIIIVQFITGYKNVIILLKLNIFRSCVSNTRVSAVPKVTLPERYNPRLLKNKRNRLVRIGIYFLLPQDTAQEMSGCILSLTGWICVSRGLVSVSSL